MHFANLKMYIEQGMILKKIHRIMKFRQSAWMEPYIQFNTRQRQLAKNDFEKSFFKLANNAVFGRTMMNVRKHKSVQLVNSVEQLRKLTSRRNYHSFTIFNPNLIAVNLVKTEVEIKQPIYVGFTVLELSKKLMYEFHYNHIVNKYGEQARLLFTDTDSLVYHIYTEDIYKDMLEDIHLFDTSEYPHDHFLHSNENKKKLGKMKDESFGIPLKEFVGLRSKMYSFKNGKKTAKGVKKSVIISSLTHQDYFNCSFFFIFFSNKQLK